MEILAVFNTEKWLFYTAIVLFSLCVGSFLNVVAYRLPLMMERDWKLECHEFLELDADAALRRLLAHLGGGDEPVAEVVVAADADAGHASGIVGVEWRCEQVAHADNAPASSFEARAPHVT